MLKYRNTVSFVFTGMMYVAVAAAFIYTAKTVQVSEKKSALKTIELSLQAYQPPVEKPQPIAPKEPEPIPEEIQPLPEPVAPKPLPVQPPKPQIKKPEPPKKIVKKEPPKKKVQKPKKPKSTPQQSARQSMKKQQSSAEEKNRFLSDIRNKIDRNKTYPHIAKRRGMQGSVKVSFTILPNGNVGNINVSGPNAFHNSAKEAVQKSFPVSVKNAPISLPQSVSFTMHYRLR